VPRVAFILAAAVLAGCGVGDDEKTIGTDRLDDLVLQPDDLTPGFRRIFVRDLGALPQLRVRYERAGVRATGGPRLIESTAHVFDSPRRADTRVDRARDALKSRRGWHPIDEPGLGGESFAGTFVQGGVRYYQVVWREANVTAALEVNGLEPRLPLSDVLELARKQQRRIAQAAG